jgi:hypothetical protein
MGLTLFLHQHSWFNVLADAGHLQMLTEYDMVTKVPLTEHHAMKAYWGSGGIALLIL